MTAAAIVDSLQSMQAAADDFLKHADNGGLGALTHDEFCDVAREVEAIRRQLVTADYPIIAEVETRALPDKELSRTCAGFLGTLWRLTPHEAAARVREASALGFRTALTGEVLAPLRPAAAEARRLGILDAAQVRVLLRTLHALPAELPVEQVDAAERLLVHAAHSLHADDLSNVARQLLDTIDPDGTAPSADEQRRRRDLWLRHGRDGMVRVGGLLDLVTGARAEAWFGAVAKPRPADDTGRDERSAGQRRHDAFADLLGLALRADDYATACGSPVTVHLTMTAEQFEAGTGHASTSYGQRIRGAEAFRLIDQACIAWAVHNGNGTILRAGRSRRLASRDQADALLARDGGCAIPHCDAPAGLHQKPRHRVVDRRTHPNRQATSRKCIL